MTFPGVKHAPWEVLAPRTMVRTKTKTMVMIRLSFLKSSLMTMMMMMFQVQTEVPQAAEKAASKATVMIVTKMRIPMMMKELMNQAASIQIETKTVLMNQKARRAFMNLTVITVIVLTNQRVTAITNQRGTVIETVVSAEQANNLLTVKSREPNTRQDIRIRDWTYLFDSGALPQHSPTLH